MFLEAKSKIIPFYTSFCAKRNWAFGISNTLNLPAFNKRFQNEESALRVNEAKIARENSSNEDHFSRAGNHEQRNNKKRCFKAFLQICDPCFNP